MTPTAYLGLLMKQADVSAEYVEYLTVTVSYVTSARVIPQAQTPRGS